MRAAIFFLFCGIVFGGPCEPGWTQYKEDCLWFSNTAKTWLASENDCKNKGGWLMTDDNEGKHEFLSTIMYAFKNFHFNKFFIGGSDTAFENVWRWLETGINVGPFSKWGTGEPDGNTTKNCLALKWENDRDLVWSDESCGHVSTSHHHHHGHGLLNYICEKPVNNSGSMVIGRR